MGAADRLEKTWQTAVYCRLSREDGDRPESDSIGNQRKLLLKYTANHPELAVYDCYADDGYTGTNFDRPAFQRMIGDIEAGRVNCVLVKDLSRFGRDYIDAGRYLERWLPEHGARFIAVTDHIDSDRSAYDMMMPLKNLFNAQYAKDISQKVKSAFRAKQQSGEFIGAFASYGYRKDPQNHNHLVIDPVAAEVVQRIFTLFEGGMGKVRIAKMLNAEKIPCPSEYKRLMGERYRNGNKLHGTTYWTYATIHRILNGEIYIGNMEQGRDLRAQIHGAAKRKKKDDWVIVKGTHEPIIAQDQWDRVQSLLRRKARTPAFGQNISSFAGYLKCGDCGRSMSRSTWGGRTFYLCGSYKRYGASACSRHYITQEALEQIVLRDLNRIIASIGNLKTLAERGEREMRKADHSRAEKERLNAALARIRRIKQGVYEDYREKLISKSDFLDYRRDYETQEQALRAQIIRLPQDGNYDDPPDRSWVRELVKLGKLTKLDRLTVAETVQEIRIFGDGGMEITYRFSSELGILLEGMETEKKTIGGD